MTGSATAVISGTGISQIGRRTGIPAVDSTAQAAGGGPIAGCVLL